MEDTVKYSDKKLNKFKQKINEKLSTVKEQFDALKGLQNDQKKHIKNTEMSFSDDSRRFQNKAIMDRNARRLKSRIRALKAALTRIENQTYGVCKRSGRLISEQRLEAMPTAIMSIGSKSK